MTYKFDFQGQKSQKNTLYTIKGLGHCRNQFPTFSIALRNK